MEVDLVQLWREVGNLSGPAFLVGLGYALWKGHLVLGSTHKEVKERCDLTDKANDLLTTELTETKVSLAELKVRVEIAAGTKA